MTNKNKLDAVINELANDLRDTVTRIEASPDTTKGHYGDYLAIISFAPNSISAAMSALALIHAGANRDGVLSAMKIAFPR